MDLEPTPNSNIKLEYKYSHRIEKTCHQFKIYKIEKQIHARAFERSVYFIQEQKLLIYAEAAGAAGTT